MSVWLTEREFRQSGAEATGVTLNVAFLREIKQDNLPVRERTKRIQERFSVGKFSPREAVDFLAEYRDSLETYFALEEFYGYFRKASLKNPHISTQTGNLCSEHEQLFLNLNHIIDLAEQIVYHECDSQTTLEQVADLFDHFADDFESHEQREMELMMRLCNEEIGVGD